MANTGKVRQITNKYAGKCFQDGTWVAEGAGFARAEIPENSGKPKWYVVCRSCAIGGEPTPQVPDTANRPTFALTSEQEEAVALFAEGYSIAIQAGAGTGKTSTLLAIAKSTKRLGKYVAFNRAIVQEAAIKFAGTNCSASTIGSLAYQQVGVYFSRRLDPEHNKRRHSDEIARHFKVQPFYYTVGDEDKVLQPKAQAGLLVNAIKRFCQSSSTRIAPKFVPVVDGLDDADSEANTKRLQGHLKSALTAAWADITDESGWLRFDASHFTKIWELGIYGPPTIPGDYILFDEAQDADPVMLSVVEQQGKQVVFVGDAQQAIYEWRGAVNALDKVSAEHTRYLTNSFRFGPEIASVANALLSGIPSAKLRLVGRGGPGKVAECPNPEVVLTRTNAAAISVVLKAIEENKSVHLVGGGGEVEYFAKSARDLLASKTTDHPELCIFANWNEVQEYVKEDPQGSELALLVKLIDDYGVESVLSAVANTTHEQDADLVVTTAHKSKGREWDRVRINGDFPDRDDDQERRLLYVAVTRARKWLDIEGCNPALKATGRI